MTDYYPLIARAVAGLDKNTGEARRGLYERARTALVAQLRGLNPPLTESEITRERLALEEAIRKVEAETARRPRADPVRRDAAGTAKPGDAAAARKEAPPDSVPPAPAVAPGPAPDIAVGGGEPGHKEPNAPPARVDGARNESRPRVRTERSALTDEGLKGFRDVVAEAETLGEATAQAAKSARQAYAAVPANVPELDRVEPRMEPRGLRTPSREMPPEPRRSPPRPPTRPATSRLELESDEPLPRIVEPRPTPPRPMPMRHAERDDGADRGGGSSFKGLIAAVLSVLVVLAVGATMYSQRNRIKGWLFKPATQQAQPQGNAQTSAKIADRIGQGATSTPGTNSDQNVAAVAQRVVLYEEDPADSQGKRYVGSVIWRTETLPAPSGQTPEVAVHADLEIPERRINMTMSVRRNTDKALPASHTIEIMFNLPADFPFGGIANVPGILMKQAEQTRGAPLAGLAVKVTSGFFLVGLSSADADVQRNLQLLRERSWFDVPIVYTNGRRAILAVEKGTPGERAFNDAFAAWGG